MDTTTKKKKTVVTIEEILELYEKGRHFILSNGETRGITNK